MKTSEDLRRLLGAINGKSYPAYKDTKGKYDFKTYILSIDHVQGDPFAAPSKLSLFVPQSMAVYPGILYDTAYKQTAVEDYLIRKFERELAKYSFKAKGSGKSGLMSTSRPGPEILKRSACVCDKKGITARFEVGFPAGGRRIASEELIKILFDFLPICVKNVFYYKNRPKNEAENAVCLAEDQQFMREELKRRSLAAFVADGAMLPRESGISSAPMKAGHSFISPESLRISMELPNKGHIEGMGIPKGITLIVGGGYHGKSTLLKAIEAGVYNHIAGDGREYVITDDSAVKLRAEDGRSIQNTDISMFINDLPNKKDTRCFSTADASGSTSQAAAVCEAIEAGSKVFLVDEDTSATNFMVRDRLMQAVIQRKDEPITPFIERVRDLYEKAGISTIMVAGSSGAYFYEADKIIQMDNYEPLDITEKTKAMCASAEADSQNKERTALKFKLPDGGRRISWPSAPAGERLKVKVFGKDTIQAGKIYAELRFVEQLADTEQTNMLAEIIKYCMKRRIFQKYTMKEAVELLAEDIRKNGFGAVTDAPFGCGLAMPRIQEIYACINRCRS